MKAGDMVEGRFFVARKGTSYAKRYVGEKNNELCLVHRIEDALAWVDGEEAMKVLSTLTVDTRNARVLGRRYDLVEITKHA